MILQFYMYIYIYIMPYSITNLWEQDLLEVFACLSQSVKEIMQLLHGFWHLEARGLWLKHRGNSMPSPR